MEAARESWHSFVLSSHLFLPARPDFKAICENEKRRMDLGSFVGIGQDINISLDANSLRYLVSGHRFLCAQIQLQITMYPQSVKHETHLRLFDALALWPSSSPETRSAQVFSPSLCSSSRALTLQNTSLIESSTALRPVRCVSAGAGHVRSRIAGNGSQARQ